MLGVTDILASPPMVRENAFVLNRVHNRRVTGHWSMSMLRDAGMQIAITLVAFIIFFGVGSRWFLAGIEEVQLALVPTGTGVADIIDRWTTRCGKNGSSTCFHVRYRYEVTGRPYFAEEQLDSSLYYQTGLEPRMQVTYAVHDPQISHIGASGLRPQRLLSAAPFLLIAVFLGVPALGPLLDLLRVRRMLRKGTLIYGVVQDAHGYTTGTRKNRRYTVRVNYEFIGSDGRKYTGEQKRTRRDLRNGVLPSVGTTVAIAFVDSSNYLML